MTPHEIDEGLERIAASNGFVHDAYQLVDVWEAAAVGFEAIEPILRFMERHPEAGHTVWMLNRIINATRAPRKRERLMELLQAVTSHPGADQYTRDRAQEYLDYQKR